MFSDHQNVHVVIKSTQASSKSRTKQLSIYYYLLVTQLTQGTVQKCEELRQNKQVHFIAYKITEQKYVHQTVIVCVPFKDRFRGQLDTKLIINPKFSYELTNKWFKNCTVKMQVAVRYSYGFYRIMQKIRVDM